MSARTLARQIITAIGERAAQAMPQPAEAKGPPSRRERRARATFQERQERNLEGYIVRQQLRGDWPAYQPKPPTRGKNAPKAQAEGDAS